MIVMDRKSPSKPRRAAKACVFCRRRKFRCDNEKPTCSSCKTYAQDCTYAPRPEKQRPTKARLSRLEEENEQLRRQLGRVDSHSNDGDVSTRGSPSQSRQNTQPPSEMSNTVPSTDWSHSAVSRIFISPNGDSSYHGLTSTLFDDAPTDRHGHPRSTDPQVPIEHIRKQLMGEAAYQRQLETLNMRQGKLDFDGVDPELGMHLLNLHWNRQHHSFLITYRPAFMRDMANGGPCFSKLLLNAIYFGASKFSNRPEVRRDPDDVRTAGWRFRLRVKELLGSALDRSEITTIQALLVMTSSLFALGDERSAAWLYAGTAFRMIIDLGMHVDATMLSNIRRLSDEDIEIRRRVFWGAFVVDKIQSLYQGRPASLQDFDTKVSITFLDQYEELEHWQPFAYTNVQSYPGSPAYSVSTFTELCKLSLILNGILNKVYSERSSNRSPQELITTLNALNEQLKDWHDALPEHLRFGIPTTQVTPPPHVLSLLALYNVLLILLHRPFVAEGHLHTTDPSVAVSSFTTCTTAANRIIHILQAYDHTFSIRRAPYLISYATYVAATIYVRVAAQRKDGSRAHSNLRTCLDIFQKNQETNWAVRRAKNVIVHLMDRMGVDLSVPHQEREPRSCHDINGQTVHLDGVPAVDGDLIPAASPSQMTPPETEASELDMDRIIQSFIRQQARPGEGQVFEEPSYHALPGPTVPVQTPGIFTPSIVPGYNDAYFDAQFDDDMLFGFNGSVQDSILYQ
ncbi:uncharacterized protein N7484_002015 [Penicillium longicatenatum]|uniref:uncharacterized protein n=1 Tax=Penicillium longicatenatum TaxID=1561947 RepID=UPI002547D1F4|nr:uncharacterized protein N7484_002015 [Penicillium longicatenatum]KAJ5658366.1 hypothetical protein N7484_002015 [Penicillium longicatenatum]